jgi:DNA repair exonuclease SbcCD ATPase subunit
VGNTPITIQLDKSPTTVVCGKSGEGKSACLLDSLYFACFGKPMRNINIGNVVNSINNSDCLVELDLKSGAKSYKIIRGLKPKIFEIYEDGKLVDQDAHSRDYQQFLETKVLQGLNERIFKQIVIMGTSNFVPFMQLPSAARREVIEELLDIKIFSNMLDIVKENLSNIKETLVGMDNEIVLVNEKITLHEENQKRVATDIDIKRKDLEKKISNENEDIANLNKEIATISEKKKGYLEKYASYDSIMMARKDIDKECIEFNNNIKSAKKMMDFFTTHEDCPTCSQHIEENHKQGLLFTSKKDYDVYESCLKLAQEKLEKHDTILETLNKVKLIIDKLDKDIYKKQTEISTKQNYISQLQKEINQTHKTTKVISTDIDALKKTFDQLKDKRLTILEDRQYYEIIAGLLKDGGIKTKIIRQYLPVFNKLINEYLIKFGLPVDFTLDQEFNEVIKSRYRDTFQYESFSAGEAARIDLALLFAWREISKNKNTLHTNLLIFDESLDTHLDLSSSEQVISTLLEMGEKMNIFAVSHKTDLSDKFSNCLKFQKHGNFTVMSEK